MNKYLLIISLVLISLLAVGSVSAIDSYNATDDSSISFVGEDFGNNSIADEIDNLEATSLPEKLEKVEEEPGVLNQVNNQSTEVLSEGNSNNKPEVTVGDISFKSGNISIPFHVAASDGSPVSGQAIVTILSEKNTLSKNVKLINGSGEVNFKLTELLGVMTVDSTEDLSDIYDIISSSMTDMKINISSMIDGFKDVYGGVNIDMYEVVAGLAKILEGNNVNSTEFEEGIDSIKNSTNINVSAIGEGVRDMLSGIHINMSKIIQMAIINITESNFNSSKFKEGLEIFIDEYSLKISDLLENITQTITFNKTVFDDALDDIFAQLNSTKADAISKIQDLMNNLSISSELKDKVTAILEGKLLNLSDIVQTFKELMDSNLTISNITDLFDFNESEFNSSDIMNSLSNIVQSANLDYDRIIDALNNTFNSSKIIDDFLNYTGINASKLSNIFDGFIDILNGIAVNQSNLTSGLKEIFTGMSLNLTNVKMIVEAIKFNNTNLSDMIFDVLDEFKWVIIGKFFDLSNYLNLNFTDNFIDFISNVIYGNGLNFTEAVNALKSMSDANNLTFSDVLTGLDNVTGGYIFNASKIIDKIMRDDFNISVIQNFLNNLTDSISFDYDKVFTGLSNLIDFNMSDVYNGLDEILRGISFNSSLIKDGLDRISQELNFNASDFISLLIDNIKEVISFDNSTIAGGINKIADAFYFNGTSILDGASKVVDSFKFDFKGLISGLNQMVHSLIFNTSRINDGINKILNQSWINVSDIMTKLLAKLGKGAVLSFFIIPDSTIYSFTIKMPTNIVSSKVTTTYGKSKDIVITLKDLLNNPLGGRKVSVKLNGKTYSGQTNAKGQLSIKVPKNLAPKTYDAVITFAGDDSHIKSSQAVKVVVSKLTPKLTAKKKTFKRSLKTKKYTVTLKTNKKKPMKKKKVTLKVNGKTYKAKTNKKGKATFKITELFKKGTYKAVIKFKGNKYYKKAVKKANIKIL